MRRWAVLLVAASVPLVLPSPAAARRGVSPDSIKVGVHTPLTGANPINSNSAQEGSDLLWRWMKETSRSVNNRDVNVILRNDNSNPSQAVAVCKEMVEEKHVFLLSGLMNYGDVGSYQQQSCARYAASVGIPYVGLGSIKVGLRNIPSYFAVSSTYADQGPLLADYLVSELHARRKTIGMLRTNSVTPDEAHRRFERALENKNASLDYDRSVSKTAGAGEAKIVVAEMNAADVDIVYVMTRTTFFLEVLQAAGQMDYHPRWVGVGVTHSITDDIADVGCNNHRSIRGARMFSPIPAFRGHKRFEPKKFDRAYELIYPNKGRPDSVVWQGWATSVALKKLLALPGRDLTRRRFIRFANDARIRTGILPVFRFTKDDHLPRPRVHVLEARCRDTRWHTIETFAKDF